MLAPHWSTPSFLPASGGSLFWHQNTNVKNVYTGHMQHLEIHILDTEGELEDAYTAGLIDDWSHILFGPTCEACNQMLMLEKREKLFILVSEQSSKILCSVCLTESLVAGMLGA